MTSEASPVINYSEFLIFLMTAKNFYSKKCGVNDTRSAEVEKDTFELKIYTLRAYGLFVIHHVLTSIKDYDTSVSDAPDSRKSKEQVSRV